MKKNLEELLSLAEKDHNNVCADCGAVGLFFVFIHIYSA